MSTNYSVHTILREDPWKLHKLTCMSARLLCRKDLVLVDSLGFIFIQCFYETTGETELHGIIRIFVITVTIRNFVFSSLVVFMVLCKVPCLLLTKKRKEKSASLVIYNYGQLLQ